MSPPPSAPSDHPGRHTDKLRPNTARAGVVERTTLIERVRSATDARVVAVVAPAGYGKSTFLAQWMERDPGSGAWLTIDRYDGDPAPPRGSLAIRPAGPEPEGEQDQERCQAPYSCHRGKFARLHSCGS